jgi:hypothetical protein
MTINDVRGLLGQIRSSGGGHKGPSPRVNRAFISSALFPLFSQSERAVLPTFLRPGLSPQPAQPDGGGRLTLLLGRRHVIGDLAGCDRHDMDGVADHVGGAALAFEASGIINLAEVGREYFSQAQRVDV